MNGDSILYFFFMKLNSVRIINIRNTNFYIYLCCTRTHTGDESKSNLKMKSEGSIKYKSTHNMTRTNVKIF